MTKCHCHDRKRTWAKALALLWRSMLVLVLVVAFESQVPAQPDRYAEARALMVRVIQAHAMTLPELSLIHI